MTIQPYGTFTEFLTTLRQVGFLPGSFPWSDGGLFSVKDFAKPSVTWHNDDPDTDPWQWRIRVLNDCDDVAYAKLFQNKTGYITREWYPYFLSVRRRGESFDEAYGSGTFSRAAKRIYDVLRDAPALAVHDIKAICGFTKEDKSQFERALVELQMRMYITMCGEARKISRDGEPYSWPSAVFCLTDEFFGGDITEKAASVNPNEARLKIASRIREIIPGAGDTGIRQLIEHKPKSR